MKNLFGSGASAPQRTELLGRFMELWARLENALAETASQHSLTGGSPPNILNAVDFLRGAGFFDEAELQDFNRLRRIRNEVVHGTVDYNAVLDREIISTLEGLVSQYENRGD